LRIQIGLALALAFTFVGSSFAAQILLAPSDVIGSNGQYSGTFTASAILDHQTGSINEPAQDGSYWLNSDNGPVNAYVVLDLGAMYHIVSFDLFNTHNANYGDRGTGDFSIEASNSIGAGPGGSVGFDLSGGIVTLVSGTLTSANPAGDPVAAQTFTSSDAGSYRYVRFSPHSVASFNAPCCGANNYGLNELRAFDGPVTATPEPASVVLLGLCLAALGLFRKQTA
jgi:hypothetical protein